MCGPILAQRASSCCGGARRLRGAVFVRDAIAAALLAQVLAQQLAGARIEHAHDAAVPLHLDAAADPARRRAVVGGVHFDAAVQVHPALAELVVAEGLDGQRQQRRLLFGEHGGHLALGGAVDARVGPVLLPAIEIGLGLFQALEAQSLSAASSWRGRRCAPPCPCDPDRATRQGRATAP